MILKDLIKRYLEKVPLRDVIILSSLNDFDGNAGALFQYMLENGYDKKYIFVWSTKRADSGNKYKSNRCVKVFREDSRNLLKRYYFYVAKFFIWDDRPFTKKRSDQVSIYSTHGVPPLKTTKGLISLDANADFALCPAKEVMDWEAREYAISKEKLFICDQPRNDCLFNCGGTKLSEIKDKISNYSKTVLWMPTFRKRLTGVCDSTASYFLGIPLIQTKEDLIELNNYLVKQGILLIIKLHPHQLLEDSVLDGLTNVLFVKDNMLNGQRIDINEIMAETDAMLSDYSTATWDYLLLNRPIGFVIPDIEQYQIGFAVDNPLEYMPGEKIKSMEDLKHFIYSLKNDIDVYENERKYICEKLHDYQDGNNCARFLELMGITK